MIKEQNSNYYKRTFAKKCEYNGIEFDSKMERDFAMFLDGNLLNYKGENIYHKPIRWERESKVFELIPQEIWIDKTERDTSVKTIVRNKKHTRNRVIYTPDFYLPDYDLFIETKGFQFDDALFHLRIRLLQHKYPDVKIWIVRSHKDFMKIDEILKNVLIKEEQPNE